ncbi:hypothetical protein [Streptomyces gibsoniae]|uniref:Uncharacterized protein n=1 Tax=Streptomyces gibsoniae TaxID=3075529 RepID=A0ABU2U7Q7_9ACTN|nr:hypothetical protein [Streptomyces sp. DSM 41699]MDT0469215.1 hypothetical protein [Streptomyces sp. DSM 41699]
MRSLSRLGVDVRVGINPSITVGAATPAQVPQPGGVLAIAPDWVGALPVDALYGIDPRQAEVLRGYGIHYVGLPAAVPAAPSSASWKAAPVAPPPSRPAASTRALSFPVPCPPPRPSATPSPGLPPRARTPVPPCPIRWSGSAACCAAGDRRPGR